MKVGITLLTCAVLVVAVWLSTREPDGSSSPVAPGETGNPSDSPPAASAVEGLPPARIAGLVRTWEREPAPGLVVSAVQDGRSRADVTTDRRGWFEVRGLRPGERVILRVGDGGAPIPVAERG